MDFNGWGIILVVVGLFLLISGSLKSEFIIYRLLVARSKLLWGEHTHRFHQIAGVMVTIFGIFVTIGYI
jgi:CheY-specific phosphatase CheX